MEKEKDMRKGYGKRIWKIRNTTARYMCLQLTLIFISLVCAAHLLTNKYITDFKKFTQFPKHSKKMRFWWKGEKAIAPKKRRLLRKRRVVDFAY